MIFDPLQPVLDVVHSTSYRALSISRSKNISGFRSQALFGDCTKSTLYERNVCGVLLQCW